MTDAVKGSTRRSLLRGGLFAAGLAGVAGLVGRKPGLGSVPAAAGSTLTLRGTGWRLTAPGLVRGDLPKRGDLATVTGTLDPGGEFAGTIHYLDVNTGHGPFASAQQETHTFHLADGTIVGMGTSLAGREPVFAIVGGTGRYAGVTGSYSAVQSPFEVGGDGTAEFIFTFNPRS